MALTVGLLRAVNVGGRKVLMADLKAMLVELGLEAPQTLLQSGNVVFASQATGAALEAKLEAAFEARFGFASDFMVRKADEWAALVAANPFPDMARDDPGHLVVTVLKATPDAAAVKALQAWIQGPETLAAVGRELYLCYADGIGTSKLTNVAIERRLGVRGTARNWNTVSKLAALAATHPATSVSE